MPDAGASIISSIFYVSPYATLPPGRGTAGLSVNVTQASVPTTPPNAILVIRLRPADGGPTIGVSSTSASGTSAIYGLLQPAFPLSATESYLVDLIWVAPGTDPNGIDWSQAAATAPVTAAQVRVTGASFDGTNVTTSVAYGPSAYQVGVQIAVYGYSGGVWAKAGFRDVEGGTAVVPVSGYPPPYRVYAIAELPATNAGGAGTFAKPFSQGPFSPPASIPQAAAAITGADYDGAALSLCWTLDGLTPAPTPGYSQTALQVAGATIASYAGGPTGVGSSVGALPASGVTALVQTGLDGMYAKPLSVVLITAAPTVTDVTLNGTTVTATVAGAASGSGWLMRGAAAVAGPVAISNGALTFTYAAAGAVGLSVVARAASADGKTTGPRSMPVALLATTPTPVMVTIATDPGNTANWLVTVTIAPLPDPAAAVASYTVAVTQSSGTSPLGTQTSSARTVTLSFAKSAVSAGATQILTVQATGASGGAAPIWSQQIGFSVPVLNAVTADADQLTAGWTRPAGLPATVAVSYAIRIIDGAGTAAGQPMLVGVPTTATSATVPLAQLAVPGDGSAVVMVDLLLGPVRLVADPTMAGNQQATAILTAPAAAAATTNPVTGVATLNWPSMGSDVSYVVRFTDGTIRNSSANNLTLAAPVAAGAVLNYAIAAIRTANGVVVTGPYGAPGTVPSAIDTLHDVKYDGAVIRARWSSDGRSGAHRLSVYDDATPAAAAQSATVTGETGTLAFVADPAKTYTVYVQPIDPGGTGLAAGTLPLFPPALFTSMQPASAATPYVYPAILQSALGSATAGPTAQAITLYLPQLGLTAGALGTAPIVSGPFTVASSGDAALPYKLTIAADAVVWGFDTSSIRTPLRTAYVALLTKLEAPGTGLAGASPYGINVVQNAVGRMLPQTFEEQLYYNHGLSLETAAGSAYFDLRPGTILRAVVADYISINENQLPSWLNGYAGATTYDFEIGSYQRSGGGWQIGFDGFLSQLAAHGALQVAPPYKSSTGAGQAGIAAAADLYYPQFQQSPYYRVFVPATLLSPSSTSSANQVNMNFAIVAAASFTILNTAVPDPQRFATAYFRGRSALEALIRISVDGVPRAVPIGSTLSNLLEQLQRRRSIGARGGVRLFRGAGPGAAATGAGRGGPPTLEVMLDWQGGTTYLPGTGYDGWSLPLLAGDQIVTTGS